MALGDREDRLGTDEGWDEAIADGPRPDGVMVPMVRWRPRWFWRSRYAIETARGLDAVEIGAVVGVVGLVFGDSISPWSWGRALGFAGKTASIRRRFR